MEKLGANGATKIVRLGHPARLLPAIQHFSLDAIVSASDETKLVEDVRKDINKALVSVVDLLLKLCKMFGFSVHRALVLGHLILNFHLAAGLHK